VSIDALVYECVILINVSFDVYVSMNALFDAYISMNVLFGGVLVHVEVRRVESGPLECGSCHRYIYTLDSRTV